MGLYSQRRGTLLTDTCARQRLVENAARPLRQRNEGQWSASIYRPLSNIMLICNPTRGNADVPAHFMSCWFCECAK